MHRYFFLLTALLISAVISFTGATRAWGTEIYIPPVEGRQGQKMEVPVIIDEVKDLAGIKLVIKYNTDILIYKQGINTEHTRSLMHVINDKTPGRLIVVMAGAKGVSGKNITVMKLTFLIKKGASEKRKTQIEIVEFQLMSDQLKEINGKVKTGIISISP